MADEAQTSLDRPLPILSWAMYDFANTIYSAVVVTAFFPLFMSKLAGRDIYTGTAQTVSMALAALIVPIAGSLADRTGKAKRYLWWFTILCCAASLCIGVAANDANYDGKNGFTAHVQVMVPVLLLFGLANVAYQASLVFYDCLLPVVASPGRQGRVSGLGVGLGYFGVVLALPIAQFAVGATGAMRAAFLVAGVAFLVSSLPIFLFVRVPAPATRVRIAPKALFEQFPSLGRTLRALWRHRPVLCFFVGNFLCTDVVNSLIMWTRSYLMKGAGYTEKGSLVVLLGMSVSAFVLGMCMGWITDRLGSKRALLAATGSLLLCIVVAAATSSPYVLIPTILVLGSGGLAGVWVAGRKFVLDVAPPGKVGALFGLYGVTQKLSVLSCTLFAAMADWAGYRVALLSLLAPLVVGIGFLMASRAQRMAEEVQT